MTYNTTYNTTTTYSLLIIQYLQYSKLQYRATTSKLELTNEDILLIKYVKKAPISY